MAVGDIKESTGEAKENGDAPSDPPPAKDPWVEKICALDLGAEPYAWQSDCSSVQVKPENLVKLMTQLRDDPSMAFVMLSDHMGIDWLEQNEFELTYRLYSLEHSKQIMVSVRVPRDKPVVPTMREVWSIAEWQEREVYDLMGILYDGHPDLRRLFLEDDWDGFPLRKDYKDDFMLDRPLVKV